MENLTPHPNKRTRRPWFSRVATWPPLVYFVLGAATFLIWAAGTAVQIQTSEAWIMQAPFSSFPTLAVYGQIWDLVRGTLATRLVVPLTFAVGVQLALILVSVGIELPREPEWRYTGCWLITLALIGANSSGDFFYSWGYGLWGAIGFTAVILFLTFCVGLMSIVCFMHGFKKLFTRSE
jgi:hypothetical protein